MTTGAKAVVAISLVWAWVAGTITLLWWDNALATWNAQWATNLTNWLLKVFWP